MQHNPVEIDAFPESWRTLIDANASPLILTDEQGRLLYGNPAWQAWSPDLRKPLLDVSAKLLQHDLSQPRSLSESLTLPGIGPVACTCELLEHRGKRFGMVRFKGNQQPDLEPGKVAIDRETAARWALLSARMNSVADVAAGLAHEINNPLGGLLQTVQLLSRNLSMDHERTRAQLEKIGFTEDEIDKLGRYVEDRQLLYFLQIIGESGERARAMVSYMVEFSRQRPAEHHEVDLVTLLKRCIELAKLDTDMRKIYQFARLPLDITADPSYIGGVCIEQQAKYVFLRALKRHAAGLHAAKQEKGEFTPDLRLELSYRDDRAVILFSDNGLPPTSEDIRLVEEGTLDAVWRTDESRFDLAVGSFLWQTFNDGGYTLSENDLGGLHNRTDPATKKRPNGTYRLRSDL